MNNFIDYLQKSKERELCLAVSYAIRPSLNGFKNKIRAYFSIQQKEVIKNIKSDSISYKHFYDVDKYIKKFIQLYSESIMPILKKGIKRGEAESETQATDNQISYLFETYINNTAKVYIENIEMTTINKLNEFYLDYIAGKLTKEKFIRKVNEYYNSDCKGWRAKEIALTESYRAFNWAYFTYMVSQGYLYKKYIACFNSPDSKSKILDGVVKFYLEDFCLPRDVIRDDNNCGLIPPLHPNSRATILMLKSND